MAAEFETVVRDLLAEALPGLFGGTSPVVTAAVRDDGLELTPGEDDGDVEPRSEDRGERLPVDPGAPTGPYELAVRPRGRVLVRLVADGAVVATLRDEEVVWDPDGLPRFTLAPRPHRDLAAVDEVAVRYSVTAVATTLRGTRSAALVLDGDAQRLAEARALAVSVLSLDAPRLVAETRAVHERDGRSAVETLRGLQVVGLPAADTTREVQLRLLVDLELRRALRDDEGVPITRVLTPGTPLPGPVAVEPRVDA